MNVKCQICGKAFGCYRSLNGHMNAHQPKAEPETVWVTCPEHGKVRAAMKGGLDNRCSECVLRNLARQCENMVPAPFAKRPSTEIFKLPLVRFPLDPKGLET